MIIRVCHCGRDNRRVWIGILTTSYEQNMIPKIWISLIDFRTAWYSQIPIFRIFRSPSSCYLIGQNMSKITIFKFFDGPQLQLVEGNPVNRYFITSHVVDSMNWLRIRFRQDSRIFRDIFEFLKDSHRRNKFRNGYEIVQIRIEPRVKIGLRVAWSMLSILSKICGRIRNRPTDSLLTGSNRWYSPTGKKQKFQTGSWKYRQSKAYKIHSIVRLITSKFYKMTLAVTRGHQRSNFRKLRKNRKSLNGPGKKWNYLF